MLTRAFWPAAPHALPRATPAHATFPGTNGKIVFTHDDDGETATPTSTP